MRYVCLDFETNGFPPKIPGEDRPLPWHSYPIQLSVDIVEDASIVHHWDTLIRGAEQLCTWVQEKVPITLEETRSEGIFLAEALLHLHSMMQEGDTIVAHNANLI